jgi:hypothetical protein
VRKIVITLALLLIGSEAFAAESASFASEIKAAEASKNYRSAIYCLSSLILRDVKSQRHYTIVKAKSRLAELQQLFLHAGFPLKAKQLDSIKTIAELEELLGAEREASAPRMIESYSDGTIAVYPAGLSEAEINSSNELRPPVCGIWQIPTIVRPTDASYRIVLKKYWWYSLPSRKDLVLKPVYKQADAVEPVPISQWLSVEAAEAMLCSAGKFAEERRFDIAEQLYKRILIESRDSGLRARCIEAYCRLLKGQHRDRELLKLELMH